MFELFQTLNCLVISLVKIRDHAQKLIELHFKLGLIYVVYSLFVLMRIKYLKIIITLLTSLVATASYIVQRIQLQLSQKFNCTVQ